MSKKPNYFWSRLCPYQVSNELRVISIQAPTICWLNYFLLMIGKSYGRPPKNDGDDDGDMWWQYVNAYHDCSRRWLWEWGQDLLTGAILILPVFVLVVSKARHEAIGINSSITSAGANTVGKFNLGLLQICCQLLYAFAWGAHNETFLARNSAKLPSAGTWFFKFVSAIASSWSPKTRERKMQLLCMVSVGAVSHKLPVTEFCKEHPGIFENDCLLTL